MEARWDELKRPRRARPSALDGVPLDQPALALAAKLLERAERAGVGVPVPAAAGVPADASSDSVGAELLALVAAASAAGVDAEAALRATARSYAAQVRSAEEDAGHGRGSSATG